MGGEAGGVGVEGDEGEGVGAGFFFELFGLTHYRRISALLWVGCVGEGIEGAGKGRETYDECVQSLSFLGRHFLPLRFQFFPDGLPPKPHLQTGWRRIYRAT